MKKILCTLIVFISLLGLTSYTKVVTIFMIGDSTMADKNINNGNTERGWGMVLQGCFDDHILVDNHAVNGRSSKSFIDEDRWQKVLDKIKPGDYVFIQFGHNDEKLSPDRHTVPGSTFDDNLRKFVTETRSKGGIPVLFNSVVRRNFYLENSKEIDDEALRNTTYSDEKINSDTLIDTHGAYLFSPLNVAKELNVTFIDANKITHDIEQSMGIIGSRKLHMWYKPGENPAIPNGCHDNTHYNIYGAHIVANALADAIAKKIPDLKKHVWHFDYVVSKYGRGNYMSLQSAVDAVPNGMRTKILILDGTWKRPTIDKSKNIKFCMYRGAIVQNN
jgi:pectinesterase